MEKYNYSPKNIKELLPNQIFVFGSNLAGIHGAGAARLAMYKWRAEMYNCCGIQGQTYAIPTKDKHINTLPIGEIKKYVDVFIDFAKNNNMYDYLVTEIGCGLAGYLPKDIAPLFKDALELSNVYLPESFVNILTKNNVI